jgi:hypothetical protein
MSEIVIKTKTEVQPFMAYKCNVSNSRALNCCAYLITDTLSLLPFQIISLSPFEKFEISPYGEDDWTEIDLDIDEYYYDGFYFISYHGQALDTPLTCGNYDARLTAADVWNFEPFSVEDFDTDTNLYTKRDDLMLPLKFSEQQLETLPIIAPCDSFLPFMFVTENVSVDPVVYLYDEDCTATELTDFDLTVQTIDGKTYYTHMGECFYPFLDCGLYKLEIVDGEHSYFSVWFEVECGLEDIPDGFHADVDADGHVVRDANCEIIVDSCIDPDITVVTTKSGTFTMSLKGSGTIYIYWGDGISEYIVLTLVPQTINHVYSNGGNIEIIGATGVTYLEAGGGQNITSFYINPLCDISELNLSGNDLTEINSILISLDSMARNDQSIDLSGGTNATHSGTGTTAFNNLVARGNEVIVN